nr:hypothetical protein [Tanacetum cinerariifolium]
MYHNLNQLQWQVERDNFYGHESKKFLDVFKTQFKEFCDLKEVNASDFQNQCWQKNFKDYTSYKPETYRCNLLRYLDIPEKIIGERVIKYEKLQMKEREVQAIKEIEKRLKESEVQKQESLVSKGAALEYLDELAKNINERVLKHRELRMKESEVQAIKEIEKSMKERDTAHWMVVWLVSKEILTPVHHKISRMNPTVQGMNATDQGKKTKVLTMKATIHRMMHMLILEFDVTMIQCLSLKCDVEKCNKVNHEAQQENALLTNMLERCKENEKHFVNNKTIKYENCKKIKLLNDKISNLKSQAFQKDRTLASKNGKFDEFVLSLFKKEK